MADSSHPSPWYRFQFNLGTLFWLMLVTGMAAAWWNDRQKFEARLRRLEEGDRFSYSYSRQPLWLASDILGAPDDPAGTAGKSWCPQNSQGADWVEVGFDRAVAASTIDLYETYSTGCVKEVLVVDGFGSEVSIWKGVDPTPAGQLGLFKVPVPKSVESVQRVKIHVDSTGRSSWACIDAVGLTDSWGKTSWATSSKCSSVYGNGSLTANSKASFWDGFW